METIFFQDRFMTPSAIGKGPDQKLKSSKSSRKHTLSNDRRITKYFQNQLKENQVEKTRINWAKLTPGDFKIKILSVI